ncbi:sigma-70 family RNA polymerase sigma factor [Micromonospora sp. NBC_01655]|uniref:RNA polymerase sigma factor n=1 Tax=Micromonospora sp. NBC_01655 TaxID=2975983 RepID=UPI00224CA56C|nr:sigma-70 family RNA polymerase sigma factor [Micromonospora sp. NBC_01655]MCX4470815.1 sigma-70 family RNA polymerase sigma factor [Micromonospora sp. NBC_01655]
MDTAAQDDTALVEAVRRGERAGLEGMYRRYADRLYTYARTMLREPEAAADAVHDAFLIASQRIGQLREPDRLRSWLYAIVRSECLRQLRERSRSLPLEEADEPVADTDPATGVNAEQVRALVHAAAAALNPGDREVVHLAIRHDLSSADIGAALGVPANHAHARLSRARSQLERALGALLVARTGARDCPTLADLIDGWQGRLTPTLRKRVSRHIESCAVCGLLRREQLSPAALLSAYTAPAFLVVADTVWPRLAEVCATDILADPATDTASDGAFDTAADPATDGATDTATDPVVDAASGGASGGAADPAGAVPADPSTDLVPAADEPPGPADARPADGPVDGPTPVATDDAVAPEGAVARGGAAVPAGVAHTVRATSRAARDRNRRRLAATAALLILLVVFGTWALGPGRPTAARDGSGQPVSGALGSPAGEPAAPAAPLPSGTATGAGTPAPAGTAGPTSGTAAVPADGDGAAQTAAPAAPDVVPGGAAPAPAATPARPPAVPRPTAAPQVATPFTVSATARVRCGQETYSLAVQATGSGTLGGAEVRWTPTGSRTSARAMTVDGSAARTTVGQLRASALTWSVRATAVDGRTAQSPTYTIADPCVRPG